MKKRIKTKLGSSIALAATAFLLGACSNETAETVAAVNGITAPTVVDGALIAQEFINPIKTNVGEALEGGTLNFGLVSANPLAGVFYGAWTQMAIEDTIAQFVNESIFTVDENFIMTQDGAATWELSEDGRTFTWTIREGVYWSDGVPLTASDWVFTYQVLASPDYNSLHFGGPIQGIVGIMDYHRGETDDIAGLRILDDRTLEMEFYEASPTLLMGGIWGQVLPKHLFADIAIADMADHPLVRTAPVGFGPFLLESVVPGESFHFVRNDSYWRGRPQLDGVLVTIVNPAVVGAEVALGNLDVVSSFPLAEVIHQVHLNNVEWLGLVDTSYRYIGFNLGHFDETVGHVVSYERPVSNVYLRRAMWHAINTRHIGESLFYGLQWEAGGLIPPSFDMFYAGMERPEFNPELAKELLEAAGFVDVDGDGYRENPDGSELVLNFFANFDDATRDALLLFFVQSWNDIGLNILLHENDVATHFDILRSDYENMDVFYAGWGVGWEVDPHWRYGLTSRNNLIRLASERSESLLQRGSSPEGLDLDALAAIYNEWQEYMMEMAYAFPTLYRVSPIPVNNRVLNFSLGANGRTFEGQPIFWYNVALSAENGYSHR